MDLRTLPDGLSPEDRCDERRKRVEQELSVDLSALKTLQGSVGHADEKNCEQMLGHVGIPIGYAGPLKVIFSSGEPGELHLPLATTEGALVASVNRGCKALTRAGGVVLKSTYHGMTRSLAFRCEDTERVSSVLKKREAEWRKIGEATSAHLTIRRSDIDHKEGHLFLTIACDTDEAMGMNMATIAAQAIGDWIAKQVPQAEFITVAGNVDSDKKASKRTYERGRGYSVTAEASIPAETIESVLKSSADEMMNAAIAKLQIGSQIAGALGSNLHAANIIAALYIATGQDAAHTVEGSLADTTVSFTPEGLKIAVRCPAILVGVRGGGTTLPAQNQCLQMLMKPKTSLHPSKQLAESICAAVLAGELSLLAAQAAHQLAIAHSDLARGI